MKPFESYVEFYGWIDTLIQGRSLAREDFCFTTVYGGFYVRTLWRAKELQMETIDAIKLDIRA